MGSRPHQIACLLAAAALALPATAWGQSAGDEQYADPFAPETGQGGDGGSEEQAAPEPAPAPAPPPATATQSQPPAAPAQPAAQQQLPRTGADAGLLALSGTLLLAGGVALRVRLSAPGPRRRGRGGRA
jgi:LPXTG-motif cell wall-anchored protein